MPTRVPNGWAATRSVVQEAVHARLAAFVAEDPSTRSIDVHPEELVVTHERGTWSWRVGKDMAIPLEFGTPSVPWRVELWVREHRPDVTTRTRRWRVFAIPHSRWFGAVRAGDDPVRTATAAVQAELTRQLRAR